MNSTITRSITALSWGAPMALLVLLGACAADGTRVASPVTVRTTDRVADSKILYIETQRLVRVPSPEGFKSTVLDFDIDYLLESPDGQRTPLPFLGARNASPLDVLNRVFRGPDADTWLGLSVRSTQHSEHVKGLEWRYVEDDFTTIRVEAFAREHLISKRDLHVCNPGRHASPVVELDAVSHVLRYCTRTGMSLYDPASGKETLQERQPCCPSSDATTDHMTRAEDGLVVELAR